MTPFRQLATGALVGLVLAAVLGCCWCWPGRQNPVAQAPPPATGQEAQRGSNVPPEAKLPPGFKPPPAINNQPKDEPPGPALEVDPPQIALLPPVKPAATLPLLVANKKSLALRYPWLPSPVVAVAATREKQTYWDVWNMQVMQRRGSVPGRADATVLVSPDGTYIAMPVLVPGNTAPDGFEIYNVANGQLLRKLEPVIGVDRGTGTTEFIGRDRFLALHRAGDVAKATIWDVKTGTRLATFDAQGIVDRHLVTVSPGGRYLATWESLPQKGRGIYVYELPAGKLLRRIQVEFPPPAAYALVCMTFSSDGKELAFVAAGNKGFDSVQAWDFPTGKRTVNHRIRPPLKKSADSPPSYPVPVEWLPDRSGWLAYGQLLIDRDSGNVFWKLPAYGPRVTSQRRFLDPEHLLMVLPEPPQRLGIVRLPRDQLAAARKR